MDLTGIGSLADFAGKILDRLSPDPTARAAQQLELAKMTQTGELAKLAADVQLMTGQMATNTAEAANASTFVAGWRPFVGWVGGLALAYVAILEPAGRFFALVFYHYTGQFPVIDTTITLQVLLGILGLGGMRSFDKAQGTGSGH